MGEISARLLRYRRESPVVLRLCLSTVQILQLDFLNCAYVMLVIIIISSP